MLKFQAESFMMKPATDFSALSLPLHAGTLEFVKHWRIWSCPTRLPKESLYSYLLPSKITPCWSSLGLRLRVGKPGLTRGCDPHK